MTQQFGSSNENLRPPWARKTLGQQVFRPSQIPLTPGQSEDATQFKSIPAGEDIKAGHFLQLRPFVEYIDGFRVEAHTNDGGIRAFRYKGQVYYETSVGSGEVRITDKVYPVLVEDVTYPIFTDENGDYITVKHLQILYTAFIDKPYKYDNYLPLGIAKHDTFEGEICEVALDGEVFDYADILKARGLPEFNSRGGYLYCTNEEFNVGGQQSEPRNFETTVGTLLDNTRVVVQPYTYHLKEDRKKGIFFPAEHDTAGRGKIKQAMLDLGMVYAFPPLERSDYDVEFLRKRWLNT